MGEYFGVFTIVVGVYLRRSIYSEHFLNRACFFFKATIPTGRFQRQSTEANSLCFTSFQPVQYKSKLFV